MIYLVSRPPRLFLRTIIAIMLMVSFYSFALVISGGLIYLSYLSFTWGRNGLLLFKITLPCVVTGCIILWSILPRIDRFTPPGPRLNREEHPKLFAEISAIAQKMNQAAPKEVYLLADVNAWVAERGGLMGIGSRRVMGIGLPLLQALSVSEFRAVLAHEFGHYYGGDTKLSPWIYKTRTAIIRTLQSLDEGLIHIVFQSFGKLFLRITYAISRYQEYVADEIAARIESYQALSSGLRKIYAAGHAYNAYWRNEFLPALNAGYLPPYAEGFKCFIQKDSIQNAMVASVEEELAATVSSPYDTHPPLGERLKALEQYATIREIDDTPVISILEHVTTLEKELIITIGGDAGKNLKPTNWDRIGEEVYLPLWSALADRYKSTFTGITLKDISDISRAPREFIRKIELQDKRQLSVENGYLYARHLLGVAVSVRLVRQGWKISAMPGDVIKLTNLEEVFEPFKAINDLFEKKLTILDWRVMCQKVGIYEISLWSEQ